MDNVLKASYEFTDQVYMSFEKEKKNIIVYFKLKNKKDKLQSIID
jgi:hypothetical protein